MTHEQDAVFFGKGEVLFRVLDELTAYPTDRDDEEAAVAAEVEAVFLEHPLVAEAALIGKPDEKWGEVGLMIVVPDKGVPADEAELLEFCRARLARYKVPKEII